MVVLPPPGFGSIRKLEHRPCPRPPLTLSLSDQSNPTKICQTYGMGGPKISYLGSHPSQIGGPKSSRLSTVSKDGGARSSIFTHPQQFISIVRFPRTNYIPVRIQSPKSSVPQNLTLLCNSAANSNPAEIYNYDPAYAFHPSTKDGNRAPDSSLKNPQIFTSTTYGNVSPSPNDISNGEGMNRGFATAYEQTTNPNRLENAFDNPEVFAGEFESPPQGNALNAFGAPVDDSVSPGGNGNVLANPDAPVRTHTIPAYDRKAPQSLKPKPRRRRSPILVPSRSSACGICGQTLSRSSDIERHRQTVHDGLRFHCRLGCQDNRGLGWCREDRRNEHIRRAHPEFRWV